MDTDLQTGFDGVAGDNADTAKALLPALPLDAARYLPELSDIEISEAQKLELLGALWSIMRSCVELGFKIDVVELVCGQSCESCGDPDTADVE